jgi:hypothetical protein
MAKTTTGELLKEIGQAVTEIERDSPSIGDIDAMAVVKSKVDRSLDRLALVAAEMSISEGISVAEMSLVDLIAELVWVERARRAL